MINGYKTMNYDLAIKMVIGNLASLQSINVVRQFFEVSEIFYFEQGNLGPFPKDRQEYFSFFLHELKDKSICYLQIHEDPRMVLEKLDSFKQVMAFA